jgi:cytochrome oxidase Cu insertion factor (SCO1/SenC/PrrC family)
MVRTRLVPLIVLALAATASAPINGAPRFAWLHGWDAEGRSFDLRSLRGQVVLLTFASRQTRDEATEVNDDLKELVTPGNVSLVSVVDLEDVPTTGLGTARKRIAELRRPGVYHLLDEKGELSRAFNVDAQHQVDIFVIGRSGEILGHFKGEPGVTPAKRLVQEIR